MDYSLELTNLFFFLVVCSDMISKGFGFVAFIANVKREQLEDQRNVGESSYNSGHGTDQRIQSLMFMMMMMMN